MPYALSSQARKKYNITQRIWKTQGVECDLIYLSQKQLWRKIAKWTYKLLFIQAASQNTGI